MSSTTETETYDAFVKLLAQPRVNLSDLQELFGSKFIRLNHINNEKYLKGICESIIEIDKPGAMKAEAPGYYGIKNDPETDVDWRVATAIAIDKSSLMAREMMKLTRSVIRPDTQFEEKKIVINDSVPPASIIEPNKAIFDLLTSETISIQKFKMLCCDRTKIDLGSKAYLQGIVDRIAPIDIPNITDKQEQLEYYGITRDPMFEVSRRLGVAMALDKAPNLFGFFYKYGYEAISDIKSSDTTKTKDEKSQDPQLILDGTVIEVRADGWVNATQICKLSRVTSRKSPSEWFVRKNNREIMRLMEEKLGIPSVAQFNRGGGKWKNGTFVHPQLATHIAMWISPKFAVLVSDWVEQWKQFKPENAQSYAYELAHLEASSNDMREARLRDKWAKTFAGEVEVETKVGRIDILTPTDVVELKKASDWKHGLGQLIAYHSFHKDYGKLLLLFDHESLSEEEKQTIEWVYTPLEIKVQYID